jgi:hypothetical protein
MAYGIGHRLYSITQDDYEAFLERFGSADRMHVGIEALSGNVYDLHGLTSEHYDWLLGRINLRRLGEFPPGLPPAKQGGEIPRDVADYLATSPTMAPTFQESLERAGFVSDSMGPTYREIVEANKRATLEGTAVLDLGMGPEAEIETNANGGAQSRVPYSFGTLDPRSMLKLAAVAAEGDAKYGVDNWRKIPTRGHINHAIAHFYAWLAGDATDDHLAHAMTRAVMAHATAETGEEAEQS